MITKQIFEEDRNFDGAKGLVFIGGKILLSRRDNNTKQFPRCVDLPGGGKEKNESALETFQREVREEFGIEIKNEDIAYAKKYPSDINPGKEFYFFVTHELNLKEDDIVFGDEGLEYLLLKPDEYLKLTDAVWWHQTKVADYINSKD